MRLGAVNSSVGEPTVVELQEMAERLLRWSDRLNADYDIGTALNVRGDRVLAVAISHYRSRRQRDGHFPRDMFGEPAWDMMLDLFINTRRGRQVSVTNLCAAAAASPTTALRYIALLEKRGHILRMRARHDGRVTYIQLAQDTYRAMERHFGDTALQLDQVIDSAEVT